MNAKYSTTTSTASTTNPTTVPLDPPSSLVMAAAVPGSAPATRRPSAHLLAQFDHLDPQQQQRHYYVSVKFLFRWLVMLWLTGGIVIYLINASRSTRTNLRTIFGLPGKAIYVIAIANHLSLIGAVYFDLGPLLILSTILQCALLVALPALIVEVIPNLLTYGVLLLSIVMLLCYGVLYMRSNAANAAAAGTSGVKFEDDNSRSAVGVAVPGSRKTSNCNQQQSQPSPSNGPAKINGSLEMSLVEIDVEAAAAAAAAAGTGNGSTTLSIPRNSCQF